MDASARIILAGNLTAAYIPLLVAAIVAYWLALVYLISLLTGWRKLARLHPADRRPSGHDVRGCGMQCGWGMHYSGCLNVTFSPCGIYLAPMWLFRLGHQPLLIPWDQVGGLTTRRFWRFERLLLPIQATNRHLVLQIPAAARPWIEQYQRPANPPGKA